MSLFGTLNTAVSGMSAQANMLGTIGDNIANAGTTGYKQATIDFETQLGTQSASSYTAGGVQSAVRYGIGDQGTLTSTTSATDLAVQGNGYLRRAGLEGHHGPDTGRLLRAERGREPRQHGRLRAHGLQPDRWLVGDREWRRRPAGDQPVETSR